MLLNAGLERSSTQISPPPTCCACGTSGRISLGRACYVPPNSHAATDQSHDAEPRHDDLLVRHLLRCLHRPVRMDDWQLLHRAPMILSDPPAKTRVRQNPTQLLLVGGGSCTPCVCTDWAKTRLTAEIAATSSARSAARRFACAASAAFRATASSIAPAVKRWPITTCKWRTPVCVWCSV